MKSTLCIGLFNTFMYFQHYYSYVDTVLSLLLTEQLLRRSSVDLRTSRASLEHIVYPILATPSPGEIIIAMKHPPLIHKQAIAVVVDVVLLDKLGKLVGLLCKIQFMNSLHLVPRPAVVSKWQSQWEIH